MDSESVLQSIGYIGIFVSVFIECGVPLGLILPLPGFSLLFTAGVFAATGDAFSLPVIIAVGTSAAVLGYIVGYLTGYKYGRKLFFERKTRKYFTVEQGVRTEKFMKRFGYATLIVGRFLAFIHNLAPIMSGIARTPLIPFMIVNVVGAIIWVCAAVFGGYYLGQAVPNAQLYVIPVVLAALLLANTRQGRRLAGRVSQRIEKM